MSERYPGGFISKNAPTVSTSGAQGVWTLEQQAAYQKAGQWPFGGPFNYIEDVFSTYLYTGNGGAQTITNGIDVKTSGGLIWAKSRSGADDHRLWDTAKGGWLVSNTTSSSQAPSININNTNTYMYATTSGFAYGVDSGTGVGNDNGTTYASWTFRKQPKFFDVVTYTGTGATQTINHNLGSTPGCIIIKNYNPGNTDWTVYHRSLGTGAYLQLNNSNASVGSSAVSAVSSTTFTVAGGSANWNSSGQSYVAYIFAHDAGGFGTSGADNVISCGSVTSTSGGTIPTVNLGFEPQWILYKNTTSAWNWEIWDNMRGWIVSNNGQATANALKPNTSGAEESGNTAFTPTATGFYSDANFGATQTYIYIAIRRGPMKTPTSGTSVLTLYTASSTSANQVIGTIPVDLSIVKQRTEANPDFVWDRLRGSSKYLITTSNSGEASADYAGFDQSNGYREKSGFSSNPMYWLMRRAPSFMDVVCYTGTGSARTVAHSLGVAPELMIVKRRTNPNGDGVWAVYPNNPNRLLRLRYDYQEVTISGSSSEWNGTAPTASVFSLGSYGTVCDVNASGQTFVAYLFATCPGVSKVGSYSGTGATQTISCGFAARWVMIKRTDSTGNWWVWDTARGMVAGTDPRLAFNVTDAESNANWVYTDASGFQIVTTDATVNASGGSYIYLAIA